MRTLAAARSHAAPYSGGAARLMVPRDPYRPLLQGAARVATEGNNHAAAQQTRSCESRLGSVFRRGTSIIGEAIRERASFTPANVNKLKLKEQV